MEIIIDYFIAEEIESMDVLLRQWQHVVMYFLLRLTMAPCIETLILLDRVLFLQEKGDNRQVDI